MRAVRGKGKGSKCKGKGSKGSKGKGFKGKDKGNRVQGSGTSAINTANDVCNCSSTAPFT